jgi:hypothetical protein
MTLPTRCHRWKWISVTNFTTGKTFCHYKHHFLSSSTRWFLSSTRILNYMLLYNVTQGPILFDSCSRRPFLEIDVKGGERAHQSLSHGREMYISRCLVTIEGRSHMSLWGERHVNVCLFSLWFFLALIFSYPTFSHYPISNSGGERVPI